MTAWLALGTFVGAGIGWSSGYSAAVGSYGATSFCGALSYAGAGYAGGNSPRPSRL